MKTVWYASVIHNRIITQFYATNTTVCAQLAFSAALTQFTMESRPEGVLQLQEIPVLAATKGFTTISTRSQSLYTALGYICSEVI